MGAFISAHIPIKNIKTFVEPFSGSFGIYFHTDFEPDTRIVYNDINRDQANLFFCARQHRELSEKIYYHIREGLLACPKDQRPEDYYKKLYYDTKDSDFATRPFELGDFDRAVFYAFMLYSAFNGCHFSAAGFAPESVKKGKLKLMSLVRKLNSEYLQNKLEKIVDVENADFETIIKKYDAYDTYFYLDPPYFSEDDRRATWYGVGEQFNYAAHMRLLNMLKEVKGKWSLSYYYFPELEQILPKTEYNWVAKEFYRSSASFSDSSNVKGEELLIMNYDLNLVKESLLAEFFVS